MKTAGISLFASLLLCLVQLVHGYEFVPPPAPDNVHREIVEEKLCLEQSGPGWGGCLRTSNLDVPEKAKFVLDNDLIAKASITLNNKMYQSEKAYHTLISAGDYALLPKYWDMMYNEFEMNRNGANNPAWFDLKFALAQTQKAASMPIDQGIAAPLQLELARYFIHGCPQNKLQGTRNIGGNNQPPSLLTLIEKLGPKCKPDPAQAVKWFTAFANNPTVPLSDTQLYASEIGDWYFNRKEYPEALGWYIATIKIADIDADQFARNDAQRDFGQFAREYLYASKPLTAEDYRTILDKSVARARGEYATRAAAARRRVALLQDLRVQAVSSFDLKQ